MGFVGHSCWTMSMLAERLPITSVQSGFASKLKVCGSRWALAGRMSNVKRSALVLGVMVVGIALLLWAGWHNLRERRLAMQKAQESRVVLVPEKGGQAASADSQSPEAE